MEDVAKLAEDAHNLYSECKFEDALKLYYRILACDLNNSVNYYNVAITYEMLKEYELAVSYYKKSIRLDDKNVRSINNLARIYVEYVKDIDMAKTYLDYAVKVMPDDAEAYNIYGNICLENKDFKLAESYFKKSIFLDEKYFKNYYLARTQISQGLNDKAKENLNKSIELMPDFEPAQDLIKSL